MAPRSTPPPQRGAFYPPSDAATYRDLLLFEERLKTNAARLKRRKTKYQLFLVQLVMVITFLLADVLLDARLLAFPLNIFIRRMLRPDHQDIIQHPYLSTGLLFIAVMTLVLFFASGMYSEKIGYSNRYVPHANRALRSFNMYLNVRSPPLRSSFFARSSPPTTLSQPPSPTTPTSPSPRPMSASRRSRSPTIIPPIPPTSNPRGELIFSSRVERGFREGYERYRASFERKREEKERASRRDVRVWLGIRPETPVSTPPARDRGRGSSLGPSPSSSRRSSPAPGSLKSSGSRRIKGKSRSGTPLSDGDERARTESFSFLLKDSPREHP